MTKLLLITSDFSPWRGGVARYYSAFVQQLPEVSVVTSVPGEARARVWRRNWNWWLWPRWLPLVWQALRWKREFGAELVAAGQLLPIGTALWLLKLITASDYAVFVHGLDVALTSRSAWKRWLARRVLGSAHLVVANSEFTKSRAQAAGAVGERTVVIYPAAQGAPAAPEAVAELAGRHHLEGKQIVLTVARLVKRKGIGTVLSVLPQLQAQFPGLVYVVVGDGPERARLEQLATSSTVPVLFAGAVSEAELAAWYSLATVFVLTPEPDPVDVEGFGIVYLEAEGAGKPVIGSRVGGVPEAVGDGGMVVSTPEELAAACRTLLGDPNLRQALGAKGKARVAQGFTVAAQAAKLKQYLYAE